jgi:hypothetical protein
MGIPLCGLCELRGKSLLRGTERSQRLALQFTEKSRSIVLCGLPVLRGASFLRGPSLFHGNGPFPSRGNELPLPPMVTDPYDPQLFRRNGHKVVDALAVYLH